MTGAVMSVCGGYRYRLDRVVEPEEGTCLDLEGLRTTYQQYPPRRVGFIMLNPSTADAETDDPTIRRCLGFARTWGFQLLTVGNLWPLRATSPADLLAHPNPDSPSGEPAVNRAHLNQIVADCDLVVAAWGTKAGEMARLGRSHADIGLLCNAAGVLVVALDVTKHGYPKHPLYVKADIVPVAWPLVESVANA